MDSFYPPPPPPQGMWSPSRAWTWGTAPSVSLRHTLWARGSAVSSSTWGAPWRCGRWALQVTPSKAPSLRAAAAAVDPPVCCSRQRSAGWLTKIAPRRATASRAWLLLPWRRRVPLGWLSLNPPPPPPCSSFCNIFSQMKMMDNLWAVNWSSLSLKADLHRLLARTVTSEDRV